ncbi:uncharacterized protein LOC134662447 isoform X2 [Cydia amplana]|uniref:uncharacterized protein LOC134662447 isoform X2 n=1 Tax=Cydia amplana TaxID=1869771 RepID=UPI002FE6BBDC
MYGMIKLLLKKECNVEDTVLIESPFKEETRLGVYCDKVILAITPNKFVIAAEKNAECKKERFTENDPNIENVSLVSIYPLTSIQIAVFKRTHRQSLKVVFNGLITRYFELGRFDRRKLWCHHVKEIRRNSPRWPYEMTKSAIARAQNTQRWTDKDLYLGSKRQIEDQDRPIPIPGIGRTEDKLYYLKPQCCGCCDSYSTEHWAQCSEEVHTTRDYENFAYTDDPNSNITYTSLMTTVGIIGQF